MSAISNMFLCGNDHSFNVCTKDSQQLKVNVFARVQSPGQKATHCGVFGDADVLSNAYPCNMANRRELEGAVKKYVESQRLQMQSILEESCRMSFTMQAGGVTHTFMAYFKGVAGRGTSIFKGVLDGSGVVLGGGYVDVDIKDHAAMVAYVKKFCSSLF